MSSPSRDQPVIAYAAAARLVARALDHAEGNGWAVAAVAVDPWGSIFASGRMDGVPAPVHDFAADKAYTAILGKSSREFGARIRCPYIRATYLNPVFPILSGSWAVRRINFGPCSENRVHDILHQKCEHSQAKNIN